MRKRDVREAGRSRRSRDRRHGGWVAYAPGQEQTPPEGVRPGALATEGGAEGGEPSSLRGHCQHQVEHAELLEARAKELLAGKTAVIETTGGTIRAQLVRFRSGAVVESWSESPGITGHAMMRMEPEDLGDAVTHLTIFLASQVADLGPDARPLG